MGWDFTNGATKSDVIRECTAGWESKETGTRSVCLKHCVRGNVLWTVNEVSRSDGNVSRYIGCDLLGKEKGFGWGSKRMEECMGPFYYSCPLEYLDMVPCPKGDTAEKWRESVRHYHKHQGRKFKVGDVLILKDGCNPRRLTVVSMRPMRAEAYGIKYRVPRRHIKWAGPVEEAVAEVLVNA